VQEPLQEEGVTTVSGWVTHQLGGFPKEGDAVKVGPYRLKVEETDGMRVTKLGLTRPPAEEALPRTDATGTKGDGFQI
jgi:CBS domain containing-hemolysin-like protein